MCCGPNGCTKRAASITFGVIGFILAVGMVVPPIYIYTQTPEPQDYTILFPVLKYGRVYLQQIVDDYDAKGGGGGGDGLVAEPVSSNTTVSDNDSSLTPGQTYKLAIFQLLDDLEGVTPCLALASFCMGCVNIPLDLLLIFGACFRKAWPLGPWLVITLVEHLVVGVPLIVFTGIISLYLASQLQLVITGSILIGVILVVFSLSMSSWFTVLQCYELFSNGGPSRLRTGGRQHYAAMDYNGGVASVVPGGNGADPQLTQPLMTNNENFYNGGGPANGGGPPYPSAPGMYPSLA